MTPSVSNVRPTSARIAEEGRPAAVELTGLVYCQIGATPRNSSNGARKLNRPRHYCCGLECRLPNQLIMFTPNVRALLLRMDIHYSVIATNECWNEEY